VALYSHAYKWVSATLTLGVTLKPDELRPDEPIAAADPDLELSRGVGEEGFVLLALPAFLPSVICSYFLHKIRGTGGPGPSPRSATDLARMQITLSSDVSV